MSHPVTRILCAVTIALSALTMASSVAQDASLTNRWFTVFRRLTGALACLTTVSFGLFSLALVLLR